LEDPGIDGRIILKWILEKWEGGIEWMDLAHDSNMSQGLVNVVK
jgi:hypothetical protein